MVTATNAPVVQTMDLTDSEVRFYQDQGYLCLPGFLRADVVEPIRKEIMTVMEANGLSEEALNHASSKADKLRQLKQYLAGSLLDDMINGDATLAIAGRLIGGKALRYYPFTAVKAGGGGGTFHFHQDNNYTVHEPAMGSINIWVALDDMTPANGCLQIIPASHRQGQLSSHGSDDGDVHQQVDVNPIDCLPIRMRAGDAVAFTRWTVHGSGPNTTNRCRVAYALQCHREDVKWLDKQTGEWKLLVDSPRFSNPGLAKLGKQ